MSFINIPPLNTKNYYTLTTANRTIMGNRIIEFIQTKEFEFSLLQIDFQCLKFGYKLLSHKMEGTSLIHQWADDLEQIQSYLVLVTDISGNLIDIENFKSIKTRWEGLKKSLEKKYPEGIEFFIKETDRLVDDKKKFMETFIGYSFWRAFFQGWYKDQQKEEQQSLVLNKYFGTVDLPLQLHSKIEKFENKESIYLWKNTANLDNKKFNRKAFSRMLKDLTDIYNIDATLSVDMEEKYCFMENGVLEKADIFLETFVNNWYSVANAHQIKLTSQVEEKVKKEDLNKSSIFLDFYKKEKKSFFIEENLYKK
ncbi:hypothetical protein ETU10_08760 [Apibacter muscae]|uniref:hypothetical protein n=1 Tax=Apibacter muscae TaxID=2509004 RepID=UPI0011ACC7E1|nr:hypothetical protein [Apibacter muscae]TWP23054.1 hypothetical protein ETU10_08760 [Apibacter muscae]